MRLDRRRALLALVLSAGVLVLVGNWVQGKPAPPVKQAHLTASHVARPEHRGPPAPLLAREPLSEAESDLFGTAAVTPVPTVSAPPMAAPAPAQAPVFPYRYFGNMVDISGKSHTYLTRDGRITAVRENDVLDQVFRIDAIDKTHITVTYLPLKSTMTVAVLSASQTQ